MKKHAGVLKRTRRIRVNKRKYYCYGGPFHKGFLFLSDGSTMVFRVGTYYGRYANDGIDSRAVYWSGVGYDN